MQSTAAAATNGSERAAAANAELVLIPDFEDPVARTQEAEADLVEEAGRMQSVDTATINHTIISSTGFTATLAILRTDRAAAVV